MDAMALHSIIERGNVYMRKQIGNQILNLKKKNQDVICNNRT